MLASSPGIPEKKGLIVVICKWWNNLQNSDILKAVLDFSFLS